MHKHVHKTAYGTFKGCLTLRHHANDYVDEMEIVDHFEFHDPDGIEWACPAGVYTNGASIPRFFWRIVGHPFDGRYRMAAAVHDVHCQFKVASHKDVHNMFFWACRTNGCGPIRAWILWAAVYYFGPKWRPR